jgi:hypothetical protein
VTAAIATLGSLILPEGGALRRDHIVPADQRGPGYDARYDFRTLVYDAVHLPEERVVRLFCPKLLNLEAVFRRGEVTLDGARVRPRRPRRHRRYDTVDLPARTPPSRLAVRFGDWSGETAVSAAEAAFAGRNVLLTLSQNNALAWIRDWALFHVREHGADAIVFFDNASTEYRPEDVLATLASVPGLAEARVIAAPMPYGPVASGTKRPTKAKFLQAGLTNLGRFRFLRQARAVLVNDVDELVVRCGARSIFDATAESRGGFLKFRGVWRMAAAEGLPRHRDHWLVPADGKIDCPAKYCAVPDGRLRRYSWGTHNLDRLWMSRRHETDAFGYLHCRDISSRWKTSRPSSDAGAEDPEARALLARVLPDEAAPPVGAEA